MFYVEYEKKYEKIMERGYEKKSNDDKFYSIANIKEHVEHNFFFLWIIDIYFYHYLKRSWYLRFLIFDNKSWYIFV